MTAEEYVVNLADFRRVKLNVERDLRKRYALDLLFMPAAAAEGYLADESARYALAFLRLAQPKWHHDR